MIKFTKVDKVYKDGQKSLCNINLGIHQGEFVFLVGHSGAGKSTMLKLLLREELVTSGRLTVLGQDISKINDNNIHLLRRRIGVIFQDFRLLKEKTAYENVELAMRVVGASPKDIKPRVLNVLKQVGLLDKANRYPSQLSGGECQRVAIARAIANKPSIIIADECTGNLDINNSIEIVNILDEINKNGTTVIMATHDIELLKIFKKRTVELKNGQVTRDTKGENNEFDV
ncbi:cell-division ATP-binding protein [[Clostridium] sordellii]|uniref:Cell division ATP-binding protein FtsE n=1 Tax=Paraclostridium sordellii TaxID=1505 RepID=A0A9P1KZ63_PARSO|nr:cell division ATP-binding protein FtsE [Paeniclostridium sordellii]MDU5021050.1 cell division ATP-binding protein FtsE [Clostridiales bacterium]AUN13402.1 cell division ATP-binding protein FtsE [Paeniclostridium sordellii]MBX9180614.1 cell division ATP-binding protein FtsE [Paeniclostridium sordellii]MCH1965236.1 cell division ATP-binding protein FtsE [Paeniclostridium sordellii]MDU2147023.1 cell division ATP-binding protein FtsE [Paeniclostridium sordellii]